MPVQRLGVQQEGWSEEPPEVLHHLLFRATQDYPEPPLESSALPIVILSLLGEAQAWGKAKQQASKSSAFLGARRKKQRSSLSTARGDREDHSPATNSRPREAVPIHTAYQTF